MSIHTAKAMSVARRKGGYAGAHSNVDLWRLSKREIIEAALRLAALCCSADDSDAALLNGEAKNRLLDELDALRANGII